MSVVACFGWSGPSGFWRGGVVFCRGASLYPGSRGPEQVAGASVICTGADQGVPGGPG